MRERAESAGETRLEECDGNYQAVAQEPRAGLGEPGIDLPAPPEPFGTYVGPACFH
jgi:hypothetical protein